MAVAEGSPLRPDEAIDYIQQSARGLQYAHEQGVVHRDIKRSNLPPSHAGRVKILDMGLAKLNEPLEQRAARARSCQWLAWSELGRRAAGKLLQSVIGREESRDCPKAAAFAIEFGAPAAGRRFLAQAQQAGAVTEAYPAELAEGTLRTMLQQVREGKYRLAATELKQLQATPGLELWLKRRADH